MELNEKQAALILEVYNGQDEMMNNEFLVFHKTL